MAIARERSEAPQPRSPACTVEAVQPFDIAMLTSLIWHSAEATSRRPGLRRGGRKGRERHSMVRKGTKRRPAPEQDKMIVEALRGVGRPVSAYELIEQLREKATLAPQTVYRSLDRLIADGQAHRLEVAQRLRRLPPSEPRGRGRVRDLRRLRDRHRVRRGRCRRPSAAWAKRPKFAVDQMTLELRGRCRACTRRVTPS